MCGHGPIDQHPTEIGREVCGHGPIDQHRTGIDREGMGNPLLVFQEESGGTKQPFQNIWFCVCKIIMVYKLHMLSDQFQYGADCFTSSNTCNCNVLS